ncbi:MAG: MarC family protein [Paludibacteraceae bacterium]|nr:MarC family protein [Paludibacteraceae bacterium]
MNFSFDLFQILSAFIVLFAVIDPLGSIPIVLNLEERGIKVNPYKVTIWSLCLLLAFFFLGDQMLYFFGVSIKEFAVAGSIILFLMALEMLLDVEIFKNNGPEDAGSIVPLAFPLFAGPAAFTSLLTIRSEYNTLSIILAVVMNMVVVFFVLHSTRFIRKALGEAAIYIIRKFFSIILMAIAVKVFVSNVGSLFGA